MSSKKGGGKGAATKELRQYTISETVLGKIRGYPPWPGIIVDVKDVPEAVANDPGRKAPFHCVQFFPTGDYGWIHPKDLSSLRPHEIDAYLADDTKKRAGDLFEGYSIARDPASWLSNNKAKREQAKALLESMDGSDEDGEQDADADADADGEGEVDELASEPSGEDGGKSRKRKRASAAADEEGAPRKKKAATKAAKEPKAPKAKKEKATTPSAAGKEKKPRASKAKSKAMVESEDEGEGEADADGDGEETGGMDIDDEAAGPSKKSRKSVGGAKEKKEKAVKEPKAAKEAKATPAKADKKDAAAKKDKAGSGTGKDDDDGDDSKGSSDPQSLKVRDWRHKLQKTFLSQKAMPKPEAMKEIDTLFTTVESYDGMTIEQLQFSKIGKVMRHIAAIPDDKAPPLDTDFRFRTRAKGLVERWHQILNANKPAGAPAASPDAKKDGSPGKKSASPAKENKSADAQAEAEVIKATNGIDLNGAEHEQSPAAAIAAAYTAQGEGEIDAAAELDADASMGDITMSEAAA